jgi:hypothetical protein
MTSFMQFRSILYFYSLHYGGLDDITLEGKKDKEDIKIIKD